MGGIGPVQLLIILVIVLLVFGTKKLRNLGSDLGSAVRGFKSAMKDDSGESADKDKDAEPAQIENGPGAVVDGEVTAKKRDHA